MEGGLLGPFSFSPSNDDIANAKCISVFCPIVLDDALESIEAGVSFAALAIAEEKIFPEAQVNI